MTEYHFEKWGLKKEPIRKTEINTDKYRYCWVSRNFITKTIYGIVIDEDNDTFLLFNAKKSNDYKLEDLQVCSDEDALIVYLKNFENE